MVVSWDLDCAVVIAGLAVAWSVQGAVAQLKTWAEYQQRVLQTEIEGMIREAARSIIKETHPTFREYHGWNG